MNVDFNPEALECPRCGKRVLVRRGGDHYHCLWCGFQRDIAEPEGMPGILGGVLAVLVVIALLA